MSYEVKRAAVIGAGVMGAAIAVHLANVGVPSLLLDVPAEEESLRPPDGGGEGHEAANVRSTPARSAGGGRDRLARQGLERALKASPALFYDKAGARLITTGNVEDDLEGLHGCDLVVEAIVERLEAKRALFARVAEVRAPHAIVSSNTSGISVNAMAAGLPEDFQRHFLVTHFFNPVRYMKLLEIVPGRATAPDVVDAARRFGTERLGKGVVHSKDTPHFLPNRVGHYGSQLAFRHVPAGGHGFSRGRNLARPLMLDLLTYSARRVPEIADSPQEVDDAMRWGFNWALGPFQTWDALGVANVAEALQADGREVPPLVRDVLERGEGQFYTAHSGARAVFMPATASYAPLPPRPSDLTAEAVRRRGPAAL